MSLSRRQALDRLALTALVSGLPAWVCGADLPGEEKLPPGWLPVAILDDQPTWSDFRQISDRVHLYLPPGVPLVRGVFVCFVFHSGDARELARLWQFALVTVPWPFEYDLGVNDKRNGRFNVGHAVGDMSVLLWYLEAAAKETRHPELAVAPLVGWLGQNGSHLCADLQKLAPERIVAWTDSFADRLAKYPELTAKVPFALAWETSRKDEESRLAERATRAAGLAGRPTPPADFKCRASTYGFPHGIYSKFNFFMAFLDRVIRLRLPAKPPPAGQPTPLAPISVEGGWAGDFSEVGEWNAIAPVREATGMVSPIWLPDVYGAWTWRSYHSAKPNLKLMAPAIEYRKANGKWGGPECGLGYGGTLPSDKPVRFAAETQGAYAQIEFHSGDRVVATARQAPWEVTEAKLEPGLHALFAVGVSAEGRRTASRPAFVVVT